MTPTEWYAEFLHRMSCPTSAANIAVCVQWASEEGMYAPNGLSFARGYNPWMITAAGPGKLSTEDIGFTPGHWNSIPVLMFASAEDGLQATVDFFLKGLGWYQPIVDGFRTQTWNAGLQKAWHIWIYGPNGDPNAHSYDTRLSDFAKTQWAVTPAPPPVPAADPLDDLLLALFAGSEQPGDRATRLAYAHGRVAEIVAGTKPSVLEIAGDALALAAAKSVVQIYSDLGRILTQAGSAATSAGNARG